MYFSSSTLLLALSSLSAILPLTTASSLTITIPPSAQLPNPNSLPPSTHATLTTLSLSHRPLKAVISRSSSFTFHNLSSVAQQDVSSSSPTRSSYLLDIHSRGYVFAPYSVDIDVDGKVVGVWETARGGPWHNKGVQKDVVVVGDKNVVEARVLGKKDFYESRAQFSPLSLFKNPMILLAGFALLMTFGMPYLLDNMDPETRAEFEKQRSAGVTRGNANAAQGAAEAAKSFDLAGWMAGTSPGPLGSGQSSSSNVREGAPVSGRRRG